MNIAVILAGGIGSRMGSHVPKQFLPLEGVPVICHSIAAFDRSPAIDEVAVVVHPDWIGHMEQLTRQYGCWCKLRRIIPGGAERYESSLNAIKAYASYPDDTNLILHDAARPWISAEVIQRVAIALQSHEAVGVGIPSTDTIWQASFDGCIQQIPVRSTMFRAQTPQAFRLSIIRQAYALALQDPAFQATDDCGVLLHYLPQHPITIVPGEEQNKKITFPEDILSCQ